MTESLQVYNIVRDRIKQSAKEMNNQKLPFIAFCADVGSGKAAIECCGYYDEIQQLIVGLCNSHPDFKEILCDAVDELKK